MIGRNHILHQGQAGAMSIALGGISPLKDVLDRFRGHAGTGIVHAD